MEKSKPITNVGNDKEPLDARERISLLFHALLDEDTDPAIHRDLQEWFARDTDERNRQQVYERFMVGEFLPNTKPGEEDRRRFREVAEKLGILQKAPAAPPRRRISPGGIVIRVAAAILPLFAILGAVYIFPPDDDAPIVATNMPGETVVEPAAQPPVVVADTTDEPVSAPVVPESAEQPENPPPIHRQPVFATYDINIQVPENQTRYLKLADNSIVLINGGSVEFSEENREVRLSGEAYFQVAQGQPLPFRVKTEYCTVNATGTAFNVRAKRGAGESVVSLVEGSVEVLAGSNRVAMKTSEQLSLDNSSGMVKIAPLSENYWWEQPLGFVLQPLPQILEYIGEYYMIDIQGLDRITDDTQYTIKFSKLAPIGHVMNMLTQIAPGFEYSLENDKKISVRTSIPQQIPVTE